MCVGVKSGEAVGMLPHDTHKWKIPHSAFLCPHVELGKLFYLPFQTPRSCSWLQPVSVSQHGTWLLLQGISDLLVSPLTHPCLFPAPLLADLLCVLSWALT